MQLISPDWPAPKEIIAFTSSRFGGVSNTPWDSFNLGSNCGDRPENVKHNRSLLSASLPAEPCWLDQVHGSVVVKAAQYPQTPVADASWSNQADTICAVLTADCLPVLLCTTAGSHFAAIHCGWRSLAAGVLENTIAAMGLGSEELLVWFGPAISAKNYEVDEQLYSAFIDANSADKTAFTNTRKGHWQADLIHLARLRLQRLGFSKFYGGHWCTYADKQFYSYRRDGITGRIVSLIYR